MSEAGLRRRGIVAAAIATALCLPVGAARADAESWRRAGAEAVARARALRPSEAPARNVVLMIGDGMGLTTVTAARILDGQLRGEPGEENLLAFERLPYLALAKTYNTNQQTPDSAGTMSAMVTGVKTKAGVISLDDGVARGQARGVAAHRQPTLLEQAEARGLATGVVTTTTLTHATPAACYAHAPERDWQDDAKLPDEAREIGFPDIARQLVEFSIGDGLEVAMGGGRKHFTPTDAPDPEKEGAFGLRLDGRDLTKEWVARRPGSAYVWSRKQLEALDLAKTSHLLGIFERGHLNFETDRPRDAAGEPSLAEMTGVALEILSRDDDGFFLMVEGGRIDHAHHGGNAYRALHDAVAFSKAVETVLDRTDPKETLVVVTADHGHVMTMGGYATRGNAVLGRVVHNDESGRSTGELARDAHGLPYTTLGYANGPGYAGHWSQRPDFSVRRHHRGGDEPSARHPEQGNPVTRPDLTGVDTEAPDYLQESTVPLRSETHSAEDVPVYAGGPGAHLFHGVQEQSNLYHLMVEALGWNGKPE